jgi:hypothetical protein
VVNLGRHLGQCVELGVRQTGVLKGRVEPGFDAARWIVGVIAAGHDHAAIPVNDRSSAGQAICGEPVPLLFKSSPRAERECRPRIFQLPCVCHQHLLIRESLKGHSPASLCAP